MPKKQKQRPPANVKVLGQIFKVKYTGPNEVIIEGDDEVLKVGSVALGFCNPVEQTITIRGPGTNTGFHVTRDTLLHEVIHASIAVVGGEEMSDEEEETFVSHLAPVLLDVLRSNPVLLAYLCEKET